MSTYLNWYNLVHSIDRVHVNRCWTQSQWFWRPVSTTSLLVWLFFEVFVMVISELSFSFRNSGFRIGGFSHKTNCKRDYDENSVWFRVTRSLIWAAYNQPEEAHEYNWWKWVSLVHLNTWFVVIHNWWFDSVNVKHQSTVDSNKQILCLRQNSNPPQHTNTKLTCYLQSRKALSHKIRCHIVTVLSSFISDGSEYPMGRGLVNVHHNTVDDF